ncbi:DUF6058 family natural product biosynthesis protein [Pseudoalteromonas ardens]|uniref:Orphan protein n=1 Tax=Pseudoalteromonas rubra TaxID=43658 RepID=A0A0L0EUF1_9GAMM|nr:DUF6058 family natural product biosynthesis protein [Pseudoalteromonas sp. R96]KNC68044.1 hypothetical protein AC626_07230 [Pseudoalteromonas rubra]MDK1310524.1 DUF6058 family natural product biosynthesis protein [Pseudoalteromonas sp. R96]
MELLHYLNERFITKSVLLAQTKATPQVLQALQEKGLMPHCSYRIALNIQCDSFFGEHNEDQALEYYAKGYTAWFGCISALSDESDAYALFSLRYKNALEQLKDAGHVLHSPQLNDDLDAHIEQEWQHFLSGTYGLCTHSGLPEDIAAKELAILEINQLIGQETLQPTQLKQLESAVNLLDSVSALFAPHERQRSSRHRLVDEVRRKYNLPAQ